MAGIEVSVIGPGAFHGRKSSLSSYSVDEAITPLDASQASPGVGTLSFGAVENPDTIFIMDNGVELRDGARGLATGTVRAVTTSDGALSVTADSILSLLNATKVALPFAGNFEGAIAYYLGLVNVSGGFLVQDEIAGMPVVLMGWRENVLTMISSLCTAYQVEMSVVYNNIVFRAPRANVAVVKRDSSRGWSIDRGSPAKTVEGYYYTTTEITNAVIYPSPLETPRNGFQVDSGEDLQPTRVQLSATPSSVNQPVAVNYLGPTYSGTSGAYVVVGSDGIPIPAAEWNDRGGKVTVQIDPEAPDYLIIDIHGMSLPNDPRAPYVVGVMSSGENTNYSAFYITGSGVAYTQNKVSVSTGATNTETDVGAVIDNRHITSLPQLLTSIQKAVLRYSGVNYVISGSATSLNRAGAGDEFATSKLAVFDTEFAGMKLSALDAMSWTLAEFDQHYADLVTSQFDNQLFGNASGARVLRDDTWFRIDSATTTQESSTFSATIDSLWSDFDLAWTGQKLSAWDTAWSGHKLRDWDVRPLRGA